MKWFVGAALLLSGLSPAFAQDKLTKADREAVAASPEDVAAKVAIENDPLDTSIKLSTEPFLVHKQGLLRVVNSDKFLRAFVDKKTGKASIQAYLYTTYGGQWLFITRATIETPTGPEDANLIEISRNVVSCGGSIGCVYREDVAIDLTEELLRAVSSGAKAGVDAIWSFRVYTKNGQAVTTSLLKTEIAGLLIAVDRERAKLGVAASTAETGRP